LALIRSAQAASSAWLPVPAAGRVLAVQAGEQPVVLRDELLARAQVAPPDELPVALAPVARQDGLLAVLARVAYSEEFRALRVPVSDALRVLWGRAERLARALDEPLELELGSGDLPELEQASGERLELEQASGERLEPELASDGLLELGPGSGDSSEPQLAWDELQGPARASDE